MDMKKCCFNENGAAKRNAMEMNKKDGETERDGGCGVKRASESAFK